MVKKNYAKKRTPVKKLDKKMRKKLMGLFVALILIFIGLLSRITYINAVSGEKYKKQVLTQAQQQYDSRVIPYKRGDILDRNGTVLATSNKVYNVIMDCKVINSDEKYLGPTVQAMVSLLGSNEEEVRNILSAQDTASSQYYVLQKGLDMEKKKAFEDYTDIGPDSGLSEEEIEERSNIVGVWFEEEYKRSYPMGSLACDTIGFMFDDGNADWGLEGYYDTMLKGVVGRQYGYFSSGSTVEQSIIQPTDGKSIKTTIDAGVQRIVEKYIQAFIHAMGSEELGVIVMDPDNGEVLAMGTRDFYDLNNPRDLTGRHTQQEIDQMSDEETVEALNNMWRNYCVTDSFEPGSTVKPLVVAAAMESGIISKDARFVCDGGWSYGEGDDEYIRCTSSHGEQTLAQVIANSCNDAMMQIGSMMGAEKFLDSQSMMNFGMKTGIDLPGEGAGVLHTKDSLGSVELATDSFGQGFMLTMIQEAAAISSVINGGYYYQPHLVSKILDSEGKVVKNITPTLMRQTISNDISASVREQMRATVEGGTGKHSKVQGYSSGGKTGTAEKFPRNEDRYLVSFIGFAPVSDPEVVVYVVIDEAHAENQENSKLSQYIAQGILSEALPYLNVEPDESEDGTVPPTELWSGFAGYLEATGQENGGLGNTQIRKSENPETGEPAEVVTGGNIPQPPDMNEEVDLNNNVESDGITNEDAGF